MSNAFFDSNVILYIVGSDPSKAQRAETLVLAGGNISVQVLNEVTSVMRRKRTANWQDTRDLLALTRHWCVVHPLDVQTHEAALAIAERFNFHIYDACIVAAAKLAGCDTLWSEDMQDGQVIDGVTIRNPF